VGMLQTNKAIKEEKLMDGMWAHPRVKRFAELSQIHKIWISIVELVF
jgi:hypothetical protein